MQHPSEKLISMLVKDNSSMKKAGNDLAEAAIRVVNQYDGIHRLSLAVSEWTKVIANEGGRGENENNNYIKPIGDHNIKLVNSYVEFDERHSYNITTNKIINPINYTLILEKLPDKGEAIIAKDNENNNHYLYRCNCEDINCDEWKTVVGDYPINIYINKWAYAEED